MTSSIPKEIFTYILSFLGPYDLASVAPVSKLWNDAQKTEELWKRHCLDYLDNAKPYQDSWKERFKIIHNWMHGIAEQKTFSSYKIGDRPHGFSILEDNTALEVYQERSSSYVIRNFSTGKRIPIDNKELCDAKLLSSRRHDKTWVVLTERGRILFFDLLTGQFLKEIKPQNSVEISKGKITFNEQEVITTYNGEIHIWDINTCSLKQVINVSHLGAISNLNLTTNFVIFSTFNRTTKTYQIYTIRKGVDFISEIKDLLVLFQLCIAYSQSYCAVFLDTQKIGIFEDTGEDLNLIQTLEPFTAPSLKDSRSMNIYNNWLLISNDKELKIYDIKTGIELSTIQHDPRNGAPFKISSRFCSNATQLFTQIHKIFPPFNTEKYYYTFYNFEPPQKPLSSSKKICCIVS